MVLKRRFLRPNEGQMDDFGGRVHPQGEPIPDPIRHDQLACAPGVKAGPIPKQRGTESALLVQHQLTTVSVTG